MWRIRDRATFDALRRCGRRARSGPVTVTWVPEPAGTRPRVGYAVGRSTGSAVDRNRLRRRLRGVVGDGMALPPGAVLVGAGPAAAALSHRELRAAVLGAMHEVAAPESLEHRLAR